MLLSPVAREGCQSTELFSSSRCGIWAPCSLDPEFSVVQRTATDKWGHRLNEPEFLGLGLGFLYFAGVLVAVSTWP